MRQREDLHEIAHRIRQCCRGEECPAEEGHGQEDVEVDLPHLLVGGDIQRREKADLRENRTVQRQDEKKERCDGEMCAKEITQSDDDRRGDQTAQHGARDLADNIGIGTDGGDKVLLKAFMVDALRVHGDDAVKADVHGVHREQPRYEEVDVRAAADVDAPPEPPAEGDEEHERRDHAAQDIFFQAAAQHDPVAPKHRPYIAKHQSPSFRPVSSIKTSSRFVGRRSTRAIVSSMPRA